MSGLRVLHVIPGLGSGGGAERSLLASAAQLIEAGIELHVATLTDRRVLVPQLESVGVVCHDLRPATTLVKRVVAIRRLVRDIQPDVVHSSLFDADVPTQLAVGRSRPMLVTWTGTPFEMRAQLRGLRRVKTEVVRLVQILCARWSASHFQAVTTGVGAVNSRALLVSPRRVHVARRGRPDHVATPPAVLDAVRSELAVQDSAVVLTVARHEPEKDVETAVAAIAALRERGYDVILVVAGRRGSRTEAIDAAIERHGVASFVRLLGARDDVAALLDLAAVVLSTSISEGAAGSIVEAMAAAKPIVVSDASGMSEVITDGVDGTVGARGDVGSFADAIAAYLDDPGAAARAGAAARRSFAERYSETRSAQAMLDLYRAMASTRPGRSAT